MATAMCARISMSALVINYPWVGALQTKGFASIPLARTFPTVTYAGSVTFAT